MLVEEYPKNILSSLQESNFPIFFLSLRMKQVLLKILKYFTFGFLLNDSVLSFYYTILLRNNRSREFLRYTRSSAKRFHIWVLEFFTMITAYPINLHVLLILQFCSRNFNFLRSIWLGFEKNDPSVFSEIIYYNHDVSLSLKRFFF